MVSQLLFGEYYQVDEVHGQMVKDYNTGLIIYRLDRPQVFSCDSACRIIPDCDLDQPFRACCKSWLKLNCLMSSTLIIPAGSSLTGIMMRARQNYY